MAVVVKAQQRFADRTGAGRRGAAVSYRRVSTGAQDAANQRADIDRLAAARGLHVAHEYVEIGSGGGNAPRPRFVEMMLDARRGDFSTLIIWALDRFGRSMVRNLNAVIELDRLGVRVISVREPWLDTSGPVRDLLVAIFSWVAEQERVRLGERTRAGLERARARGARLGRPRRVITPAEVERALELQERGTPIRVIAQRLRIPRTTIHHHLALVLKRESGNGPAKSRAKRTARGASRKRTIRGR